MIRHCNCLFNTKLMNIFFIVTYCIFSDLFANANSHLTILNLPDDANVIINGNKVKPDSLGHYIVSKGLSAIQIEYKSITKYSTTLFLKEDENKSIHLNCTEECASVDIVSDPLNASVQINGEFVGITPYFNGFMRPGDYSLKVTRHGYEPIYRNIIAAQNNPLILTLNMEPSIKFNDSMVVIKKTQKKSRQFIQKIILGSLAAIFSGSAIYFEMNAHQKLSAADKNAADYDLARSDFSSYRSDYESNRSKAQKDLTKRNIFYIAAGVSTVGFAFSFMF
jgi:hypothetical protein